MGESDVIDPSCYQRIIIESLNTNELFTIPLEIWGTESFGFSDYHQVKFSNGALVELLVEVELPEKISVTIKDKKTEINLHTLLGLAINYESPSVGYVTIKVGVDIPSL